MGPDRIPQGWPLSENSQFIKCAGTLWHTQIIGTGPIVLLLHGTGASTHSFADLALLLSKQFTCVLVDLPGQGFTRPIEEREHLLPAMALAVQDLCDHLDMQPEYIIGHSAGAAVAIRMCLDTTAEPRALLSINGALLPFGAFIEPIMLGTARMLSRSDRVIRFLAQRGAGESDVRRALRDTGAAISEPMIQRYTFLISQKEHIEGTLRMMGGWELGQLAKDLSSLTTPIHLVGCAQDHIVPAARAHRIKRLIEGATSVTLNQAGHLVHEASPDRIYDEFLGLIKRVN